MTSAQPPAATAPEEALLPLLPLASRLALSYAPAAARAPTLALLALDMRLAGLLRHSREPMLAQLRFAWWRETLRQDSTAWPSGEPLLALLRSWNAGHGTLEPLVDGWEALTGAAPLPAEALSRMADGRAGAFAALATVLGRPDEAMAARALGRDWALADLAMRLSHPAEREAAKALVPEEPRRRHRLGRALRPLLVLHGLARRRLTSGEEAGAQSPGAVLLALRLGLLGR